MPPTSVLNITNIKTTDDLKWLWHLLKVQDQTIQDPTSPWPFCTATRWLDLAESGEAIEPNLLLRWFVAFDGIFACQNPSICHRVTSLSLFDTEKVRRARGLKSTFLFDYDILLLVRIKEYASVPCRAYWMLLLSSSAETWKRRPALQNIWNCLFWVYASCLFNTKKTLIVRS